MITFITFAYGFPKLSDDTSETFPLEHGNGVKFLSWTNFLYD